MKNIVKRIENVIINIEQVKVEFNAKGEEVVDLQVRLAQFESLLALANEEIAELQVMIAEKDGEISELQVMIAEKDGEIAELQEQVVSEEVIADLADAISRLENAFIEPIE